LKKILIIALTDLDVGGIETYIKNIICLSEEKFAWYIVGNASNRFKRELFDVNGLRIINISYNSKLSVTSFLKLYKLINNIKPDIIHSQEPRSELIASLIAFIQGINFIHTLHMSSIFWLTGIKYNLAVVVSRLLRKYLIGNEIFVSRFILEQYNYLSINSKKQYLIYNGIKIPPRVDNFYSLDTYVTSQGNKLSSYNKNSISILFVGRLVHQKGFDRFLNIIKNILDLSINVFIVGEGPQKNQYENEINILKSHSNTIMFKFMPSEILYEVMSLSDILIMPSRWECMPFTLVEAMSLSTCCIVSDVGDARYIIDNGNNGFLANNTEDTIYYEQVIRNMVSSSESLNAIKSKAVLTSQKYSVNNMVDKTTSVYLSLLNENTTS